METLEFERRGRVGWLRLNRPEKLNAMNALLWAELAALGPQLRDDHDLRAVVVTGNGRAFSAGIDLASFDPAVPGDRPPAVLTDRATEEREQAIAEVQEGYLWLHEAWYPTIAAVRGYAFGAGFQLALACDLRVAARGTRFGMLEAKYGLMPDLTGTQFLPRVVGPSKAKELIFTAAQVDANEALRIGLVNQVVDDGELESTVEALAERLAGQPPIAIRWAKQAVDAAGRLPVREGLRFEHRGQAECVGSADFQEAIAAFREGRPPVYSGS
jgi:enoyl-CoA hydratase/carnithine racemase